MAGFGIFAPNSGVEAGRNSRKGGPLSTAGARVANNPINWGQQNPNAGGGGGGGAYPQQDPNFPPASGYAATQNESAQQLAYHATVQKSKQQYMQQQQQQQQQAQQFAAAPNQNLSTGMSGAFAAGNYPQFSSNQMSNNAYAAKMAAQAQAEAAYASNSTTGGQYGAYVAGGRPAVSYKPQPGSSNPIAHNQPPADPRSKLGGDNNQSRFQTEASRQYQGQQQQQQQQLSESAAAAGAPSITGPNYGKPRAGHNQSSSGVFQGGNFEGATTSNSYGASGAAAGGSVGAKPSTPYKPAVVQNQAAGAVSSVNPRDGAKGTGAAAALGFSADNRFEARATTASQYNAGAGAAGGAGGGGKSNSDLQAEAAQTYLNAKQNQRENRKTPVPQGLNGIANSISPQHARMKAATAAPLDPAVYYVPDHTIYGKKNPQNRGLKGQFNILSNYTQDEEAARAAAAATFRTTNQADFNDKGIAVRKPINPPAQVSALTRDNATFDSRTTSGESFPKYDAIRPPSPAHIDNSDHTDAIFHPPNAAANDWKTENALNFDPSQYVGAVRPKPVYDRTTQQITSLSHGAEAKFDSATTSSSQYHAFPGHKPSLPFKPKLPEGENTILFHGQTHDVERFQTESGSRYQHGKSTKPTTGRTSQAAGSGGYGTHASAAAAATAAAPSQAQPQHRPNSQQMSTVFNTGPAAGGADMPFFGGKAKSVYQNNSSGVNAAFQAQIQQQNQYPPQGYEDDSGAGGDQ